MNIDDTNIQAMAAKMYTVSLGYYNDPYGLDFVPRPKKRDAIINRGYWARAQAFRLKAHQFIVKEPNRQIINIGCGLDTLFYRLWQNPDVKKSGIKYVQIDLKKVFDRKVKLINSGSRIKKILQPFTVDEYEIKNEFYRLTYADITKIQQVQKALEYLSSQIQTLIISQCVFVYIKDQPFYNLMKYLVNRFKKSRLINYQMMNAYDSFGKMMVNNFNAMGLPLVGINRYASKQSISKMMQQLGWKGKIQNMLQVYNGLPQRKRIQKIEFLDQFQQWNLIMDHYFFLDMKKQ